MSTSLVYPIYYYPPNIEVNNVIQVGVTTDGLSTVYIQGTFPIFGFTSEILYMPPQGYINWYKNNTAAMSASNLGSDYTQVYNQCVNNNLESAQTNAISSAGLQLITWTQYVSGLPFGTIIPARYEWASMQPNECYALIDPTGQWSGSWTPGNPTTNPTAPGLQIPLAVWIIIFAILGIVTLIVISRATRGQGIGVQKAIGATAREIKSSTPRREHKTEVNKVM